MYVTKEELTNKLISKKSHHVHPQQRTAAPAARVALLTMKPLYFSRYKDIKMDRVLFGRNRKNRVLFRRKNGFLDELNVLGDFSFDKISFERLEKMLDVLENTFEKTFG